MPAHPFKKARLSPTPPAPRYRLTSMKEKSSTLLAGPASGGGGPSVPSVDSRSVLDWSTLVLRWSLEPLCGSPAEVASVWEDSEDRRLPGSCLRADTALLSGDGDSGARLRERREGRRECAGGFREPDRSEGGGRKRARSVLSMPGNETQSLAADNLPGHRQALPVMPPERLPAREMEGPRPSPPYGAGVREPRVTRGYWAVTVRAVHASPEHKVHTSD